MDFTKSLRRNENRQLINGETVNYVFFSVLTPILYFTVLRLFSLFAATAVSTGAALAACAVYLFYVLNRFVFIRSASPLPVRILFFLFQCVVDASIYYLVLEMLGTYLSTTRTVLGMLALCGMLAFNYYFSKYLIFKSPVPAASRVNGRLYRLFWENRFVVLSAGLAAVIMLFVLFCYDAYPFGDVTILRMDLYHQYGPLFGELYDRLVNFESFLYSWTSGGGSSFLGNFFNYLSSPISLLVLLFERANVPSAIAVIILVKACLSAASFTLYLKLSQNRHGYLSAGFGLLYAFCGYFLAYYWNVMWLDALYLLPIILYGIELIINKGKYKTFLFSLSLMMISSYYMAMMVCIFSAAYFLVYYFSHYELSDQRPGYDPKAKGLSALKTSRFLTGGALFGGTARLAAALCAVTLLPTVYALQASSATSGSFPAEFQSYFSYFDLLGNHLAGLETTIRSSGGDVLPNIYSSVIVLLLVPLYMLNSSIRLREKVMHILLLAFLLVSFNNNYLNFIWHGFHFPNDLPYRFSFMYTFLILLLSFRVLVNFKSVKSRDVMLVGMLVLFYIVIQDAMPNKYVTETFTFYVSVAFVMIYTCILTMVKRKTLAPSVLSLLMLLAMFTEIIIGSTDSYSMNQTLTSYAADYEDYREVLDTLEEEDDSFYRTELYHLRTRMDPSWYGYRGMSVFSSMAYEDYSRLQYSLGMFGNRINSYTYKPQTPLYNAMFSLKYILKAEDDPDMNPDYYEALFTDESSGITVYQNQYFLPISFTVDRSISDWDYAEGDPFAVQNSFWRSALNEENVFLPVDVTDVWYSNVYDVYFNGNENVSFTKISEGDASITFELTATEDASIYLYVTSGSAKQIYINSERIDTEQSIGEPYILDLGHHLAGDIIQVEVDLGESDSSNLGFYAYYLDDALFQSGYEQLAAGALDIASYTATSFT
ncbi:MAG: YfhO family protein, partial [Clostridiales bacterium]|nr:YfhO family protein [Clostridiales bacterium]